MQNVSSSQRHGRSLRKLQFPEPSMQRSATDPELLSGLGTVTIALIKSSHNEPALVLLQIDLVLGSGLARQNQFRASANSGREISGCNLLSGRQRHPGINSALQFAHVARPVILEEAIHGIR